MSMFFVQMFKITGFDLDNEQNAAKIMQGAENYGREASAAAYNDIALAKRIFNLGMIGKDEMKLTFVKENMILVRLNSGGLLLYAPVKIHDETLFGQFLKDLGKVEYIVAPSSEHNLQLPAIIKKFPEAKIVATKINEMKLNHIKALPRKKIDFDYTNNDDLDNINKILRDEGVEMFHIDGDVCTNALICVAHKVALECDILYTHDDGDGFLMMDQEEFRKLDPDNFMERLFKFRLLAKPNSPNGYLPAYRFWPMDPQGMWPLIINPPAEDGSSCKIMANSLRTALSQDFEVATGVHFKKMSADKFRRSVDANWNWLDGESLLPK